MEIATPPAAKPLPPKLPLRAATPAGPTPPPLPKAFSMASAKCSSKSRILLIGAPGSGKTVLGCMLPKPLILDLDNNIEGPITFITEQKILTESEANDVIIVRPFIDGDGNLVKRADRWTCMGRAITAYLKEYPDRQTIFIDSLSAVVAAAMDEVRRQGKIYIAEDELGDSKDLNKTVDEPLRIQDWGAFVTLLEQLFIRLSGRNLNLVVSAHTKDDEVGEGTGVYKTFINCPGSFREKVAGMFSESWLISREIKGAGATATSEVYIQTAAGGKLSPLGLKSAKQIGAKVLVDLTKIKKLFAPSA
jgi:hypothetical protein